MSEKKLSVFDWGEVRGERCFLVFRSFDTFLLLLLRVCGCDAGRLFLLLLLLTGKKRKRRKKGWEEREGERRET